MEQFPELIEGAIEELETLKYKVETLLQSEAFVLEQEEIDASIDEDVIKVGEQGIAMAKAISSREIDVTSKNLDQYLKGVIQLRADPKQLGEIKEWDLVAALRIVGKAIQADQENPRLNQLYDGIEKLISIRAG